MAVLLHSLESKTAGWSQGNIRLSLLCIIHFQLLTTSPMHTGDATLGLGWTVKTIGFLMGWWLLVRIAM